MFTLYKVQNSVYSKRLIVEVKTRKFISLALFLKANFNFRFMLLKSFSALSEFLAHCVQSAYNRYSKVSAYMVFS